MRGQQGGEMDYRVFNKNTQPRKSMVGFFIEQIIYGALIRTT
jgi:hypothetical protein